MYGGGVRSPSAPEPSLSPPPDPAGTYWNLSVAISSVDFASHVRYEEFGVPYWNLTAAEQLLPEHQPCSAQLRHVVVEVWRLCVRA